MEFKGTKGKWEVQKLDLLDFKQLSVHAEGEAVTLIYLYKEYKITQQKEADALLISKAPEMLEALHKVLDTFHPIPDSKKESEQEEVLKQIEQLIKEATEL